MSGLGARDATRDHADVASSLLFESGSGEVALTIAIPTFERPALLRESLASALAQRDAPPFEVLIADNASAPERVAETLAHLRSVAAERPDARVRYFVNAANTGMFGNWNRCLTLARGEWVTLLNDDDLLAPGFLGRMTRETAEAPGYDSYISRFAYLDQRAAVPRPRWSTALRMQVSATLRFGPRRAIALTPRRLFWGNIAGSSLGCLFRRSAALAVGGFKPEEFPSADYLFHVRMALRGGLRQVREALALTRLQVNESMKPETLKGFVVRNHGLRLALVEQGAVPARWAGWSPWIIAHDLDAIRRMWGVTLDRAALEQELGLRIPAAPSAAVWAVRAAHGGV